MQMREYIVKHRKALVWSLLFLAVVIDRSVLLSHFSLEYLDDDQAIMWNGALEYSKGNFFEPYFFGQAYNTMLESLLAIPLIQAGLSYAFSLSAISSLLTLLPFVILSLHLFSKRNFNASLVALAIPLLLPPEYGMMTSIPRGMTPGIFLSFLGVFCLLREVKGKFFLFAFFSCLGLIANPNSALLIFPFAVVCLYRHSKSTSFYIYSLAGAVVPLTLAFLAAQFYKTHPEYVVHNAWPLDFSLSRIKPANWDSLFGSVTPLFWYTGMALFPMLLLLAYVSHQQKNRASVLAVWAVILLVFVALSNNKVLDGIDSVFYSRGRMFLAIPILLALFVAELRIGRKTTAVLVAAAIVAFPLKLFYTGLATQEEVRADKEHNMYVIKIDELQTKCELLNRRAEEINAELIVVHNSVTEKHMLNYACPCLINDLPPIIEPQLDRRTWRLKEVDNQRFANVLLAGVDQRDFQLDLSTHPEYVVYSERLFTIGISRNKLTTGLLLKNVGLPMRRH